MLYSVFRFEVAACNHTCLPILLYVPSPFAPFPTPLLHVYKRTRYSNVHLSIMESCTIYYLAVGCCAAPLSLSRSTSDASAAFAAGTSSLLVPSFRIILVSPLKPM
jgi:hypothetical protein